MFPDRPYPTSHQPFSRSPRLPLSFLGWHSTVVADSLDDTVSVDQPESVAPPRPRHDVVLYSACHGRASTASAHINNARRQLHLIVYPLPRRQSIGENVSYNASTVLKRAVLMRLRDSSDEMKLESPYGSPYWPRHRNVSPAFLILRIMITTLICYSNWTNIFVNHFNVVYCLLITLTTVTGIANVVSFLSVIIANASGIIHNTSFNKKQLSKMRIGALDYLTREGYLSSVGLSRTGTSTHGYIDSLLEWLDLGESGMSSACSVPSLADCVAARRWVLDLSLVRIALFTMALAFVSLVRQPAS